MDTLNLLGSGLSALRLSGFRAAGAGTLTPAPCVRVKPTSCEQA